MLSHVVKQFTYLAFSTMQKEVTDMFL